MLAECAAKPIYWTWGCDVGKYKVCCRLPSRRVQDKPQIHSSLVSELAFCLFVCLFLRGRTERLELVILWRFCDISFLNCSFGSCHVFGLCFSGWLVLESESVSSSPECIVNEICGSNFIYFYDSSFSTLMRLPITILVIWLCWLLFI